MQLRCSNRRHLHHHTRGSRCRMWSQNTEKRWGRGTLGNKECLSPSLTHTHSLSLSLARSLISPAPSFSFSFPFLFCSPPFPSLVPFLSRSHTSPTHALTHTNVGEEGSKSVRHTHTHTHMWVACLDAGSATPLFQPSSSASSHAGVPLSNVVAKH